MAPHTTRKGSIKTTDLFKLGVAAKPVCSNDHRGVARVLRAGKLQARFGQDGAIDAFLNICSGWHRLLWEGKMRFTTVAPCLIASDFLFVFEANFTWPFLGHLVGAGAK